MRTHRATRTALHQQIRTFAKSLNNDSFAHPLIFGGLWCRFCVMSAKKSAILTWLKSFYYWYGSEMASTTKTQPAHTTNQDPTPCSFALSLSMGTRSLAPPNHGATALQCHTQVTSHQGCARCHCFARLGDKIRDNEKKRQGGCLGLRWPPIDVGIQ